MALYLKKIEQNELKIAQLTKMIKSSKAKRKKLMDENARLSYLSITEEYKCDGRELLEILAREHEQSAKLEASDLTDNDINELANSDEDKNSVNGNKVDNNSIADDSSDADNYTGTFFS